MRLLVILVLVPLVAAAGWLTLSGRRASGEQTHLTFPVERRSFKVTLQEKGELKAAKSIEIQCEVEGRSTIIYLIPEGSHVKKGDLLVELASDEIVDRVQTQQIEVTSARASLKSAEEQLSILIDQNRSNRRTAELKLRLARLELDKYMEGEWEQQLNDAELRVEETRRASERLQEDLKASATLVEKKYITRTEFETDKFNAYKAEIEYQKARRDLEILQKYTHVAAVEQKQSDVHEAEKELERVIKEAEAKENEQLANLDARTSELKVKEDRLVRLQQQMAKTKIYAPADGMVVYGSSSNSRWGDEDQIKEGAEVRERQTLMELPDTSRMKVVVRIHEAQTQHIRQGQYAVVTVEGIEDRQFAGEVKRIAVLADSQHRWMNPELKEYETEILLDEADPRLKPGVTARAEILIADLANVVAVPVQSVYTKGSKRFVFVGDRQTAAPVEVQLGLSGTEFVEVTSGLDPGTEVLLAVSDAMRRELPDVAPRDYFKHGEDGETPQAAKGQGGEETGAEISAPKSEPRREGERPQRRGGRPRRADSSS